MLIYHAKRQSWVASCRDGFLPQPSEPWRLQDPNAVFFEKADTIPHLTQSRHHSEQKSRIS
jgi:hypothetical protein